MKPGRTRVLVVAGSDAVSASIEATLRDEEGLHLVVGRVAALRRLIEEHDPAVILLALTAPRAASDRKGGVASPGSGGIRTMGGTLQTLDGIFRAPPVILVVDDPRSAWHALARRGGVHAVLGRDATAGQIAAAIGAAAVGLIALHPDVVRPAAGSAFAGAGEERAMTAREREILAMMAEGLSNRMIAHRLRISRYTVKFHVASILDKLRARSRTEAVTLGVRAGLIAL